MEKPRRKRVTVWLYEDQLEFIERVRKVTGMRLGEAIRFSINMANLLLNSIEIPRDKLAEIIAVAYAGILEERGHTKTFKYSQAK